MFSYFLLDCEFVRFSTLGGKEEERREMNRSVEGRFYMWNTNCDKVSSEDNQQNKSNVS
jgi:hypothetical protein